MEPSGFFAAGQIPLLLALAAGVLALVGYARAALAERPGGGRDRLGGVTGSGGVPERGGAAERGGEGAAARRLAARRSYTAATVLVVLSWLVFLGLLATRNFRSVYVSQYTSLDLAPIYLLAASWAGRAGSFFLWLILAWLIGLVLRRAAGEREAGVMAAYTLIPVLLIGALLVTGPFRLWPAAPADGVGLNPQLIDPWMIIHPPATFLGYVLATVPFSFLAAARLAGRRGGGVGDGGGDWTRPAWPWAIAGLTVLGAAIGMGGMWAYTTLGWGGWWGWDPVENASLLPWLTATVLLHGLIVQRARGVMARTSARHAALTFVLVIAATFLTRSGLLRGSSVHAYADPGLTGYLAAFLAVVAVTAVLVLSGGGRQPAGRGLPENLLARENLFFFTTIVLAVIAAVVALATLAPVVLTPAGATPTVPGPDFYRAALGPPGIFLALLMGLCPPIAGWGKGPGRAGLGWAGGAAAAVLIAGLGAGLHTVLDLLFLAAAGAALGGNVPAFVRAWNAGGAVASGGPIAHFGIALMLIAVAAGPLGRREHRELAYQSPVESLGYELTFRGWTAPPGSSEPTTAVVELARSGRRFAVYPQYYTIVWGQRPMLRAEPGIHRAPWRDVYITPVAWTPATGEAGGGVLSVQVAIRPLMNLLWIGMVLALTGGMLAAAGRRRQCLVA